MLKTMAGLGRVVAAILPVWGVVIVTLFAPRAAAADDFRLAPGDVLRVMVVGAPDLTLDVPIEMDGMAWFPLVGPIVAGGESLDDVRRQTADAYAAMSLGRAVINQNGGLPQIIETGQVHVTVAEYRPIYIAGGTSGIHEIAFRTGLTLRQVLALTSGVPAQRDTSRSVSPGEIEAAATALAHEYAQIWRLKSFLETDTPADYDRIVAMNLPQIDEIVTIERSILEETRAGLETQKSQLRDEIDRLGKRMDVLSGQKQNEEEFLALEQEDLTNLQQGQERGVVLVSRVSEARRAALVTAGQVLQVELALETARAQAAEREAAILSIDNEARIHAWNDLGDALARLQQRHADLAALAASAGGAPQSELFDVAPTVAVTRDGMTLDPETVSPSLAMMPGDIVEFRVLPMRGTAEQQVQEAGE
jgi:polysaccharide export outer membrane protein